MSIKNTICNIILAGSAVLSGCGANYVPENITYSQKQKKADDITREGLETISSTYQNVEDYLKNAEKELNEEKKLLKTRMQEE